MSRLRSALWLPLFDELADPTVAARLAADAEAAGWEGCFVWDQLCWRAPVRQVADPWIALAAMATATERLRLGPMVTPLPRRRPAKVARETATLDRLKRRAAKPRTANSDPAASRIADLPDSGLRDILAENIAIHRGKGEREMKTDDFAGPLGAFYSFCMDRPRLGRALGRRIWRSDFEPMYRSLAALADLSAAAVLDVPCGAGLALAHLDPGRIGRYVGVDASPSMLRRAAQVVQRRHFGHAELLEGDVSAIPVSDKSFDVCLLYNGLHCFPDPEAAVGEVARCTAPGGRLIGSMLVRGADERADRMMAREAGQGRSSMGPGGTADDLARWLDRSGFAEIQVDAPDTMALFSARR